MECGYYVPDYVGLANEIYGNDESIFSCEGNRSNHPENHIEQQLNGCGFDGRDKQRVPGVLSDISVPSFISDADDLLSIKPFASKILHLCETHSLKHVPWDRCSRCHLFLADYADTVDHIMEYERRKESNS